MILVVKGKDKKSRKQLKQGFKIFLYVPLSIFWWIWAKLLHSVQKRYTLSSARGVQNWVTTLTSAQKRNKIIHSNSREKPPDRLSEDEKQKQADLVHTAMDQPNNSTHAIAIVIQAKKCCRENHPKLLKPLEVSRNSKPEGTWNNTISGTSKMGHCISFQSATL
jgi:hypothetical protein